MSGNRGGDFAYIQNFDSKAMIYNAFLFSPKMMKF